FFPNTATTDLYTLSLHDALPIFLIVAMFSLAGAAINLNSSKSNAYRQLPGTTFVSASTLLVPGAGAQTVYTTQPTGDFFLTQFCAGPGTSGTRLAATGFGDIAHTTSTTLCYTFQPGVIMPKGAAITCVAADVVGTSGFCMIAGLFGPQ